jgi:hypothetical protein
LASFLNLSGHLFRGWSGLDIRVAGFDKPYPRISGSNRCADMISLSFSETIQPDTSIDQHNLHVLSYLQLDADSRDSDMSYQPRDGTCHPLRIAIRRRRTIVVSMRCCNSGCTAWNQEYVRPISVEIHHLRRRSSSGDPRWEFAPE